jgi:hypothetical protein
LISKQRKAFIFVLKSRVNFGLLKYIFDLKWYDLKQFAVKVIFNSVFIYLIRCGVVGGIVQGGAGATFCQGE